jgi:hypothetical protein
LEADREFSTSHFDAGAFAGPPRGSIEDRLRRIARLRDMGALTRTEYEKAKAKLLRA